MNREKGTVTERHIPLLDLRAQHRSIREEVMAAISRVADSQQFILGEQVVNLETSIGCYCQSGAAIGCASGSDALFLALLALGIQPGDEVLTTPYTFFATVGAIARIGAVPVFVDIEPGTFNMDMNQVADLIRSRPAIRAIIPIHLFGGAADMDALLALARKHGASVIEDAAQSIGAEYKGRRVGSIGDIGCFSFFPSKNLGAFGDGGMLTTNDAALAEKLRALRVHGSRQKYYHEWVGVNSRLDALQAAVLNVKLRYLDSWTEGRQRNARRYRDLLAALAAPVGVPREMPYQTRHVYNQFVVRCEQRDRLRDHLAARGIGTEVYYPLPLHLQQCFAHLGYGPGDFPISEGAARDSLALPIHAELSDEELVYICEAVGEFYH